MQKKIHDIFSSSDIKEKKEVSNRIPIVVDTREKQSLIAANLIERNANIKFEKLDIGDYLINSVIIERKTFSDFQNSIIDKRLVTQLSELKKYPKQILILEGFAYNYLDSIIHENAIRGMIISSSLDFNVPIIFTENEEDTAKYLITLAKRYEKERKDFSLRHKKSEMNFEQQKQFILEGFPGIGPTIAKKLLEKYKTLRIIFQQTKEKLLEIESLDEKKVNEFKNILEK